MVVLREGEVGVPVCCYDGIAFYVDAFGFGFLADGGAGGSVFSFLEGAGHIIGGVGGERFVDTVWGTSFGLLKFGLGMDKPRRTVRGDNSGVSGREPDPPTLCLRYC